VLRLIDDDLLPRPSYVLDDGSEMFPADYFRLADDAGGPAALPEHSQSGFARPVVATSSRSGRGT
jgi:hypothetical protein